MRGIFSRLLSSRRRHSTATAKPRLAGRMRPSLWKLEDRLAPAIFTVTTIADGAVGAPGDLPGSLRQAVFDANNTPGPDTIDFGPLFAGSQTITMAAGIGSFPIESDITITGPGVSKLTIDANGELGVFLNVNSSVADPLTAPFSLSGMKITKSGDSAIVAATSSFGLVVTDVEISGNTATDSGVAIFSSVGANPLTLTNVRILNNRIETATGNFVSGALTVGGSGPVTIDGCVFDGNSIDGGASFSLAGGAIGVFNTGPWTIKNTSIVNNTAVDGGGGGIWWQTNTSTLTIENSTIARNRGVNSGGAILFASGSSTVTVRNSTISGNTSGINGGAFRTYGGFTGAFLIQNSTFAGNSAAGNGGGISRGAGVTQLTLESTVVSGNIGATGPNIGGAVLMNNSMIGNNTGATVTGTGNIVGTGATPIDALLSTLSDFGGGFLTQLPLAGSPLINAGSNPTPTISFDQRGTGFPRDFNGGVDIGAIEANAAGIPLLASSTMPAPITTAGGTTATITLTFVDDVGINFTSIGAADITVTGPGGPLTVLSGTTTSVKNETPLTGTYVVQAPGGTFDAGDSGSYTVTLNGNQVSDNTGALFVAGGPVGNFFVAIGKTIVVNETNDEAVDTDMKVSLREAIIAANSALGHDTIVFDPAVFSTSHTIGLGNSGLGELFITDSVKISPPAARLTLDGQFVTRGIRINGSPGYEPITVSISKLTMNNHLSNGDGGAILFQVAGNFTVDDCTFDLNQSATGDFSGGAIAVGAVNLTVTNSVFTGNIADLSGGAIFTGAGTVILRNNTISGNFARRGGGFLSQGGVNFLMENTTVTGNNALETTTSGRAGGLGFFGFGDAGGSVTIRNSTVTNNTAAGLSGGGIHLTNTSVNPVVIESSIIAGNFHLPNADPGTIVSPDYYGPNATDTAGLFSATLKNSIIGSIDNTPNYFSTNTGSLVGTLVTPVDPLLGPAGANGATNGQLTHALLPGSPALNTGSNPGSLLTDQRGAGFNRFSGTGVDMGAFELQVAAPPSKVSGGVVINNGAAQRSRVTSLKVNFDSPISFIDISKAFTLTRDTGGNPSVGLNTVLDGSGLFVTITFTGGEVDAPPGNQTVRSLVDGKYTFTIVASQVANGFDGGSGVGSNFVLNSTSYVGGVTPTPATGIFRNFGDATGDGFVGPEDFLAFRLAFLTANDTFDYDGMNNVDANVDFLQFRLNFLTSV